MGVGVKIGCLSGLRDEKLFAQGRCTRSAAPLHRHAVANDRPAFWRRIAPRLTRRFAGNWRLFLIGVEWLLQTTTRAGVGQMEIEGFP